jgi:hypothetical protein
MGSCSFVSDQLVTVLKSYDLPIQITDYSTKPETTLNLGSKTPSARNEYFEKYIKAFVDSKRSKDNTGLTSYPANLKIIFVVTENQNQVEILNIQTLHGLVETIQGDATITNANMDYLKDPVEFSNNYASILKAFENTKKYIKQLEDGIGNLVDKDDYNASISDKDNYIEISIKKIERNQELLESYRNDLIALRVSQLSKIGYYFQELSSKYKSFSQHLEAINLDKNSKSNLKESLRIIYKNLAIISDSVIHLIKICNKQTISIDQYFEKNNFNFPSFDTGASKEIPLNDINSLKEVLFSYLPFIEIIDNTISNLVSGNYYVQDNLQLLSKNFNNIRLQHTNLTQANNNTGLLKKAENGELSKNSNPYKWLSDGESYLKNLELEMLDEKVIEKYKTEIQSNILTLNPQISEEEFNKQILIQLELARNNIQHLQQSVENVLLILPSIKERIINSKNGFNNQDKEFVQQIVSIFESKNETERMKQIIKIDFNQIRSSKIVKSAMQNIGMYHSSKQILAFIDNDPSRYNPRFYWSEKDLKEYWEKNYKSKFKTFGDFKKAKNVEKHTTTESISFRDDGNLKGNMISLTKDFNKSLYGFDIYLNFNNFNPLHENYEKAYFSYFDQSKHESSLHINSRNKYLCGWQLVSGILTEINLHLNQQK